MDSNKLVIFIVALNNNCSSPGSLGYVDKKYSYCWGFANHSFLTQDL